MDGRATCTSNRTTKSWGEKSNWNQRIAQLHRNCRYMIIGPHNYVHLKKTGQLSHYPNWEANTAELLDTLTRVKSDPRHQHSTILMINTFSNHLVMTRVIKITCTMSTSMVWVNFRGRLYRHNHTSLWAYSLAKRLLIWLIPGQMNIHAKRQDN